jgi:hypothetical protein
MKLPRGECALTRACVQSSNQLGIALGTGCGRTHGEDGSGKTLITLVIRVFSAAVGLDGYAIIGRGGWRCGHQGIATAFRVQAKWPLKRTATLVSGNYLAR